MRLSRRKLLATAAFTPFALKAQASSLGADSRIFEAAVRQIGGVVDIPDIMLRAAESEFTRKFGNAARHAFVAAMDGQTIEMAITRAGDQADTLKEQITFITSFLYTGEVQRDNESKTLYYPWCLAWNATGFTKPPGVCGGPAFGHWEHAPWQ
ncbi:hypothetical protein [Aestuariispira ectoiniformans]|uniref:hypothetical protein n=1 Tax=Aestuariispira ectoiniformans TaxID=2775080 RepID=UPI00223B2FE4|nr:hypothetical protein [Aestuariispira ectoiniformans]